DRATGCPNSGPCLLGVGGAIIAHEFTHHLHQVYDEYQPAGGGGAVGAECAPGTQVVPNGLDGGTNDPSALNYSLMDDFLSRVDGCDWPNQPCPITLREYCVAQNHDPDQDNSQTGNWKMSVWEMIAQSKKYPARLPSGLPDPNTPPGPTVNFE